MNDLTKRSFKSFRGITTHPEGSFSSTTSISCKSLKFVPHLLRKFCYRKFSTPTQGILYLCLKMNIVLSPTTYLTLIFDGV